MTKRTMGMLEKFLEVLETDEKVAKKLSYHKAAKIIGNYRQDFAELLKNLDEGVTE